MPILNGHLVVSRPRSPDLTNKRFGRLVVIAEAPRKSKRRRLWLCRCDCGSEKVASQDNLGKRIFSCGCFHKERIRASNGTHLRTNTVEYATWERMKNRCYNTNSPDYEDYGGRGITVCERWRTSFENFFADMGLRPSTNHSLDRYPNNDGNYEPGNCRWATRSQQARNRRAPRKKTAP